jgi:hypothetical protein
MWWLLIAVAIAAVWLIAILFDFVPPPNAKILIKIHHGELHLTRGQLRAQPREFITDILQEAKVTKGFIAITYYKRAAFSRSVPNDIRQRLRNVLLNDW